MSARKFEMFSKTKKRFGNVTIEKDDKKVYVKLHSTYVARFIVGTNRAVLNSGGWRTVTTKTCINEALRQAGYHCRIFSHKGNWMLYTRYGDFEFEDCMIVDADGCVYNTLY